MSRKGTVKRRDGMSRRYSTCRRRPIVTAGATAKGDDSWRVDSFDWDFREHTSQSSHNTGNLETKEHHGRHLGCNISVRFP